MNVLRETFYLLLHMQGFRENVSVKKYFHCYRFCRLKSFGIEFRMEMQNDIYLGVPKMVT